MGLVLAAGLASAVASAQAQAPAVDKVPASGGDIVITPIGHASVQIEHGGTVIQVDPVAAQGDVARAKPGDLVLITDIHGDHLDPATIAKLRKAGAPIVIPAAAKEQVPDGTVMANGETRTVGGVAIQAVAAYNLERGPKPGALFHTKGRGNGYILTLGDTHVYLSGDTECVPEIEALKDIDVAFLPMNLPYTMPPAETAACAKTFMPKILYPYHFRGQKTEELVAALKGTGIDVRVLDWYPSAKDEE
jgi:L-ascorbate metabolism protein UlaG (beta-lactamase superfamily)